MKLRTAPWQARRPDAGDVFAADFSGLSSVTMSGVGRYPTTEFAVNGITVGSASAVPEPSSTVLFMAGTAASLALAQRRRSSRR